ncbi:MAG: FAD:protein FMN transferase [Sedimentisphaerales bacterium]|nr:FAD:protein FMN transferase [Sedimentisphaerales bacterium]
MQNVTVKRLITTVAVLAGLLGVWLTRKALGPGDSAAGGSAELVRVDSDRLFLMGTFAEMKLLCDSRQAGEAALEAAMTALATVDRQMNIYRPDSELSLVNRDAPRRAVEVSQESYILIQKALRYCELTGGAFNITVGPLLTLWRDAAQEGVWPSSQQLDAALRLVGCDLVELSGDEPWTVRLARAGVNLNLNAMAKGYGVDCALAALRRDGVRGALVNIGGEIACFGDSGTEGGWLVGVQDPFVDIEDGVLTETPRWTIRLTEAAVATSGNYRQYRVIDGRRVSHIVDPRSGVPADALPSVTVISPHCADADALATAISVMGPEEGLALVESLPGVEAFLVGGTAEQPIEYRSSGFGQYER